jgi:xanthine dehydrogenase accessory factor
MVFDWIKRAHELKKKGRPFAVATVINTVAPTSAKPMSKAIIHQNGDIEGWIGGGCSIHTVITEGLNCIQSGKAIVLRLSPENISKDKVTYKKEVFLNCESGGTLEFHIEPVLPMTKLIIYGSTPTVYALAKIGSLLNYECYICSPNAEFVKELSDNVQVLKDYKVFSDQSVAVVATQGENDLHALKSAIDSKSNFISMIISNKKASSLFFQLEKEGYSEEDISRVKFPAGMDINANTPEEIAVSILAELINDRNSVDLKEQVIVEAKEDKKEIDPICKMIVDPKNAADTYKFDDINYYFCCTGCKEKFALEPSSYIN